MGRTIKETGMMKILITGAKGFVGKNLVEAFKNIRDGKDRVHRINGLDDTSSHYDLYI